MIKLPLKPGSIVLGGKYRNHQITILRFEKDELNQPILVFKSSKNSKTEKKIKLLTVRIQSVMPPKEELKKIAERKAKEKEAKKAEKLNDKKIKKESLSIKNMLLLTEDIDFTKIDIGDSSYEIGFDDGCLVVGSVGGNSKVWINNEMLSLLNTIKDIISKEYKDISNIEYQATITPGIKDRVLNKVLGNNI